MSDTGIGSGSRLMRCVRNFGVGASRRSGLKHTADLVDAEAVLPVDTDTAPAVDTNAVPELDEQPVIADEISDQHATVGWLKTATLKVVMTNGLRQLLTTGIGAVVGLLMARMLGPHNYGLYSAGMATAGLVASFGNLGIGLTSTRELAQYPERQDETLGTALIAQTPVGIAMGIVLMVLALNTHGVRGHVMLVMVPAMLFGVLSMGRAVFSVHYNPVPLAIMDLVTTVVESAITLTLIVIHAPIVLLALNVSLWSAICSILAYVMAKRHVRARWTSLSLAWAMIRRSVLVGFVMTLASLYFTIDMALLGYLVPAAKIGHYAASVKLLNLVALIPGLVMTAGIPGIARLAGDRDQLSRLEAAMAHWTAVVAVPIIAALAVFAHPVVMVIFGSKYLAAVPLLRVMMIAGVFTLINNLLGITLVTMNIVRPQVVYNLISLVVNVAGNIILAPRYGVIASAWLTVGSEAIVCVGGAFLLRRHVNFWPVITACWKPVFASAIGSGVGLALGARSITAIAAGVVCFLVCAVLIKMVPTWTDIKELRSGGFVG